MKDLRNISIIFHNICSNVCYCQSKIICWPKTLLYWVFWKIIITDNNCSFYVISKVLVNLFLYIKTFNIMRKLYCGLNFLFLIVLKINDTLFKLIYNVFFAILNSSHKYEYTYGHVDLLRIEFKAFPSTLFWLSIVKLIFCCC